MFDPSELVGAPFNFVRSNSVGYTCDMCGHDMQRTFKLIDSTIIVKNEYHDTFWYGCREKNIDVCKYCVQLKEFQWFDSHNEHTIVPLYENNKFYMWCTTCEIKVKSDGWYHEHICRCMGLKYCDITNFEYPCISSIDLSDDTGSLFDSDSD